MNDSQNKIIIEGLILQIETLRISLTFANAKLTSSCKRPEGHERHPSCDCYSQEIHDSGACQ